MKRFTLIVLTGAIYSAAVLAAPVDEHVRGKIVSVSPDTLVTHVFPGGFWEDQGYDWFSGV